MPKKYDQETLNQALMDIRSGAMTVYRASKIYKIPNQTLQDKIKNRYTKQPSAGHSTVLTANEEELIVRWVHRLSEIGFPVTKDQLLHSVSKLIKELNRKNTFKDGIPGRHWYEGFLKRNPSISKRVCQALTTARVGATEERIRDWFEKVRTYFDENNLSNILLDPSRIFNCDESAFFLCPKGQAVLVRKGQKSVYCRSGNDEKECLTLLLGSSAEGKLTPKLALFPYKRIPHNIIKMYPKSWSIGRSDNGWMTCENFYEYIANVFNPFLEKENVRKPVILYLDGHDTHLSLPLTTFCRDNGIILVALLASSTHTLQPMDVAVFHSLKNSWRKKVHSWRMENNGRRLKREEFGPLLEECISQTLRTETLQNGFRCCGLFPFDPNDVDYSKLLKSSHTRDASSGKSSPSLTQQNLTAGSSSSPSSCLAISRSRFISDFEYHLGQEKMKKFKESNEIWDGDIKDENLFYFWRKINVQALSPNNLQEDFDIGDSTLVANQSSITDVNFDWDVDTVLEGFVQEDGSVFISSNIQKSTPISEENVELPHITSHIPTPDEITNNENNCPLEELAQKDDATVISSTPIPDDLFESTYVVELPNGTPPTTRHTENLLDNNSKKSEFPTPFKNALLWPETPTTSTAKKHVKKKIIPTVATAEEYIEHLQRVEKEKAEITEMRKKEREKKTKEKSLNKDKQDKEGSHSVEILKLNENKNGTCTEKNDTIIKVGDYVVVTYEGQKFPGIVTKLLGKKNKQFEVKTMATSGSELSGNYNWRWPEKDDVLIYEESDVLEKIEPPVLINKRGIYSVNFKS